MDEEIQERLDKLVKTGKITEEERKLLEEAINKKSEPIESFPTEGKRITVDLSRFVRTNIEIVGEKDINKLKIEKGVEFVEVERDKDTFQIRPKLTYAGKRISILGIHIGHGLFLSQTLRIVFPIESDVLLNNVSGDLYLQNISGDIVLKTVSGDISLENVKGNINVRTVDGDVRLNTIQGKTKIDSISGDLFGREVKGEVSISLKSGDINIEESDLNGFIKTYSGDIRLRTVSLNGVEVATFSGDTTANDVILNGNLLSKTFSGDCILKVKDLDAKIKTKIRSGEAVFKNSEGNIRSVSNTEFIVGEGKYEISLKTSSGDIKIEEIKKLKKEKKNAGRN